MTDDPPVSPALLPAGLRDLLPPEAANEAASTFPFSGTSSEGVFVLRPIVQRRKIEVGAVRPHQRFHLRIYATWVPVFEYSRSRLLSANIAR